MQVSVVAGARPNFMKIAPVVRALRAGGAGVRIVHTGQHYDSRMSGMFFEELQIPQPDVNLGVGSGSHVTQIAEVMKRLEPELAEHRPDVLVVVGDVNSTLAAALAGQKLGVPVAHVEAGLRSFDRTMPEEINRILTDALSDLLYTSEPVAEENLRREGVPAEKVRFVGNVMIDTLQSHLQAARSIDTPGRFGLARRGYAVLTLHRPSNVDDPARLESILEAVTEISRTLPVIFPAHPRTHGRMHEFGFDGRPELMGFTRVEPQGYLAMLGLMCDARLVLTDSGGMQEETTALRVPCLTIRENTERPITITQGSNRLVGWQKKEILREFQRIMNGPELIGTVPEKWDGQAAERIAADLLSVFEGRTRT